jgi:hypothetical protein
MPNRRERGSRPPRGDRAPRGDRPDRHSRPARPEPFSPVVAVDFYPEEEPFKVLSQAIKNSCRTFELFEIARLILEKPDRFVCVVRDPEQKEGDPARLFACVPDGLPFASEEEALAHTFRHYMGEFFNVETIEVEAPSGSFQMVHKCGMTGDLLGPPNYHRYQAICREHHAAKLGHVPYERFEQRIESSREEEDIQAWLDQMKTQTRYALKENPEQVFENQEDARLYLATEARDKLIRPAYSARFSGKSLTLLHPGDKIRRSVEYLLEGQKRFPLETANHLRGRLRRLHFAVYKRGSKGVSFVCAVKRHFRKPDEVLADNLQSLIDFLEAKPNFPAKDLPKAYLGAEPAAETPAAPEAPAAEAVEGDAAPAAESAPEAEKKAPEAPVVDEAAFKQLKTDLHYLVSQGYVIEYSDGRLFVPPIREDEIRHLEKEKEKAAAAETKASEEPPVAEAAPAEKPDEEPPVAEAAPVEAVQEAPVEEPAQEAPVAEATPEPEPTPEPEAAAEPEKAEVAEKPDEPAEAPEPEKVEAVEEPEPAPVAEADKAEEPKPKSGTSEA